MCREENEMKRRFSLGFGWQNVHLSYSLPAIIPHAVPRLASVSPQGGKGANAGIFVHLENAFPGK